MGKADQKKWRAAFRKAVLERDGYRCKVCGESGTDETLDPHHITDRHELPNGGYVAENGITLCKKLGGCHELAEALIQEIRQATRAEGYTDSLLALVRSPFFPKSLYKLIGSSYERAVAASGKLSDAD